MNFISKHKFLFVAGAILILPIVLTQTKISIFDFTNSGQIGDTIGGITGPFVGLVSAYLVYKAFIIQVEANKIQSKNNEFAIALKLIDDLDSRMNNENNSYEFTYGEGKTNKVEKVKFFEIVRFWNGMIASRMHYAEMIVLTIKQINYFKKFVERSPNLSTIDKSLLLEKASLTFGSKLHQAFGTLLATETVDTKKEDRQFYAYCRKFYETTLQDLLFHLVDIDEFNSSSFEGNTRR